MLQAQAQATHSNFALLISLHYGLVEAERQTSWEESCR